MARQLKNITARRRLCLDEDENIVTNKGSTREDKENVYGNAQCSTAIDDKVAESIQKDKPKGYKLRVPSNVKYCEEHDSEDFSPDCSEYVPSPERLLDSRSTSSLDVNSHDMENIFIKKTNDARVQENDSRSTSSLGGDSHIIENLLVNENISRPPSTVSNLSLILGETDFVASPNIVYVQNNIFNSPRQDNKKQNMLELKNKEKFPFHGLVDISLKPRISHPQSLLSDCNTKMDICINDDPNKTLTPSNTRHDTTLTNLVKSQEPKIVEEDDLKDKTITYNIEITIEPESPDVDEKSMPYNMEITIETESPDVDDESKLCQQDDKKGEQNIQESNNKALPKSIDQENTVEVNQEHIIVVEERYLNENEKNSNDQKICEVVNLEPLDFMNQATDERSVNHESEKQRPLEIPIQIIPIEASTANNTNNTISDKHNDDNSVNLYSDFNNQSPDIRFFDQEQQHDSLSRPRTPTQDEEISLINDTVELTNEQASQVQVPDSEKDLEEQTKKLTRKRKRNQSEWRDNKNKRLKNSGKEYEGARNKKRHSNKTILSSCNCKKGCGLKFNDERRQSLHKHFYELANREHQWQYISRHVKAEDVKKITINRKNKRTQTYKYYFPLNDGDVQVCKLFFVNTLSITEQMIYTALQKVKSDESLVDNRGLHLNRPHRMKPATETSIKTHIDLFPRIESHYIRKDSKRQYLDGTLNISKMYRLYKIWFAEQNYSDEDDIQMASKRQYERIFNTDYNLSYFQPKKDQCTLCSKFQQADSVDKAAMEENYNKHIKMKDRVREIKNKEKNNLNKEDTVLAIFDLQQVINVPRSEVSIFHYKRKYPVYNFTIFDALNKQGFCYVWHAVIGKKGCIEIGSCLMQFIQFMFEKGIRKFIFYSDGCYGQNKNRYIFAFYLYIAMTMQIEITHKFFVGGHSQNEGDSMHACIERALKNKVVYTPDQIYNIIINAKVSGEKYTVKEMEQSEIYDLKKLVQPKRWQQNKKGEKVRWSDIMEVHVSHTMPNCFLFKYDYDDEYSELDYELSTTPRGKQTRRRVNKKVDSSKTINDIELKPAYNNLLPITKALYDDLHSLCNSQAIPHHYHSFYNNLTHSTSAEDDNNDDSIL